MKLALVGPTYPFRGGISHHTTRLYHALKARHSVDFVTFRRQYPSWLFPGKTDRDPSSPPIPSPANPLLDPLNPVTWFQTAAHIKKWQPDVLIMPWWEAFWAPSFATVAYLVKRDGVRLVFVCHNLSPHEPRPTGQLSRIALAQGDGFVVQSEGDEQKIRAITPHTRVRYVPHPIYAQPITGAIHRTAQADDKAELLFFGFVRPYKGLRILIEALPLMLGQKPVHLTVAGEFWERREGYEQLIDNLGIRQAVTLIDRYVTDEELDALFTQTDLAVLPYLSVTTSAALGFAIGHGTPVVVSDVGDLGKIVRENGIGAVAVPGDKFSLAQAIVRALHNQQLFNYRNNSEQMQINAQRSWELLVQAIETLGME